MFYTYAISSLERNYIYVGITSNTERRLNEHNSGKNKTTRPYRPFELIFEKDFQTRAEARIEEIKLKSGFGKEFLRSLIQNQKKQHTKD
ncbi:putative endonuclease [Flagellimonas taeanensis]|uniref:Endonuclease n=1 Tax=Flagellimonas taeanensis TaxID=1005926 RepID=A0A1M6TL75_9FLAO|nr:GIY-YIG nuclease family protein [Allomuricauda taeanensis]MEE1962246.1 GIY-YIG nuclease family protein [Allomuricauda taeanensis]SFB89027.1 putative endonuclease [Allomuricauda taeanensis]SHK57670.1 putative endonuclease [Allomuricauda taeanensis]